MNLNYIGRKSIKGATLIIRKVGGLGDILMHRLIFNDVKTTCGGDLHFACPAKYLAAVSDHPSLDAVIPVEEVDVRHYGKVYDTTSICMQTECALAPESAPHRSDIWAAACKTKLRNHSMCFRITDEELATGRALVERQRRRGRPVVAVSPVSAFIGKDLGEVQANVVIEGARELGLSPFVLHSSPVPTIKADTVVPGGIREWLAVIAASDYVVSVDTACFHAAGGLGRPLVGVFAFTDGKVYGKYYNFVLVQRHRDHTPGWTCGPCYNWTRCSRCPSSQLRKPCIEDITGAEVVGALRRLVQEHSPRTP